MNKPKLRKLDRFPIQRDGETLLVLRCPHRLDEPLAVDPMLADYLDMMDGQRTVAQLRQTMLMRGKPALALDELEQVVQTLSDCGFLQDKAFQTRWAQALREFIEAPSLPFELQDIAYPADPDLLMQRLGDLRKPPANQASRTGALVLPYSPFPYPTPNPKAAQMLTQFGSKLDGILVLASSHHDGAMPYQLLTKDYRTPLGPLRHPQAIAKALCAPRPWLLQEALRFRGEASLESPLLAIRARYGAHSPPVLTLLCGRACLRESDDEDLLLQSASLLSELSNLLHAQHWLVLASAQLGTGTSHDHEMDPKVLVALSRRDQSFFRMDNLARIDPVQRPLGAAVFATLLSLMPDSWSCETSFCERVPAIAQDGTVGHAYVRFQRPML